MKPIYWILIIAAILVLVYGYSSGWFSNPKNLQTPPMTGYGGTTQTISQYPNSNLNAGPLGRNTYTFTGIPDNAQVVFGNVLLGA